MALETVSQPAARVLVAYATRHGATKEIAEALAGALRRDGHPVDLRAADHVETLDPYDAAVLGSAVYYGHWLDPARDLATRFAPGAHGSAGVALQLRTARPAGSAGP